MPQFFLDIHPPAKAEALGLPREIYNRPPFPGPALDARVIGEVTRERVDTVRKATKTIEDELSKSGTFQYLASLHEDKLVGVREEGRSSRLFDDPSVVLLMKPISFRHLPAP